MDKIEKLTDVASVKKAYEELQIATNRVEGVDKKFISMPEVFTVQPGIAAVTITIGGKERRVPSFIIKDEHGNETTLPVGSLFAGYVGNVNKASQITKQGSKYKDRWMVSNSKKVNRFAENKSEAEFILYCIGKTFRALESVPVPVYSGFVTVGEGDKAESVLEFHATQREALLAIEPKEYRPLEEIPA